MQEWKRQSQVFWDEDASEAEDEEEGDETGSEAASEDAHMLEAGGAEEDEGEATT